MHTWFSFKLNVIIKNIYLNSHDAFPIMYCLILCTCMKLGDMYDVNLMCTCTNVINSVKSYKVKRQEPQWYVWILCLTCCLFTVCNITTEPSCAWVYSGHQAYKTQTQTKCSNRLRCFIQGSLAFF